MRTLDAGVGEPEGRPGAGAAAVGPGAASHRGVNQRIRPTAHELPNGH